MKKLFSLLIAVSIMLTWTVSISALTGDVISTPVTFDVTYPPWDVTMTPLSFTQLAGTVTPNMAAVTNNTIADIKIVKIRLTGVNDWKVKNINGVPAPDTKLIYCLPSTYYTAAVIDDTAIEITPRLNGDYIIKKGETQKLDTTHVNTTPTSYLVFNVLNASRLSTGAEGSYNIATMETTLAWA